MLFYNIFAVLASTSIAIETTKIYEAKDWQDNLLAKCIATEVEKVLTTHQTHYESEVTKVFDLNYSKMFPWNSFRFELEDREHATTFRGTILVEVVEDTPQLVSCRMVQKEIVPANRLIFTLKDLPNEQAANILEIRGQNEAKRFTVF